MDIKDATVERLQVEIEKRKNIPQVKPLREGWPDSPIGRWKVTTEGDCEGRSTKTLGIFEGHIVDIALALKARTFYSLQFEPSDTQKSLDINIVSGDEVSVVLNINSGTWPTDMNNKDRADSVNSWLKREKPNYCPEFQVLDNNYYASVKIVAT